MRQGVGRSRKSLLRVPNACAKQSAHWKGWGVGEGGGLQESAKSLKKSVTGSLRVRGCTSYKSHIKLVNNKSEISKKERKNPCRCQNFTIVFGVVTIVAVCRLTRLPPSHVAISQVVVSRPWRLVVRIFSNRPSLMRNTTRNSHHTSARHHFVKLVCNVSVLRSFTLPTPAWFTHDNIHEHKFQLETNDWRPL